MPFEILPPEPHYLSFSLVMVGYWWCLIDLSDAMRVAGWHFVDLAELLDSADHFVNLPAIMLGSLAR